MVFFNFDSLPHDAETAVIWAKEAQLLPYSRNCNKHRIPRIIRNDCLSGRFVCPRNSRCQSYAVSKGTFFELSHIPLATAISLMYAFARTWSYEAVQHELVSQTELSSATICSWYRCCREIAVDHFTTWVKDSEMVGGPGIIVDIYEAKLVQRNYYRGRVVKAGYWMIAIVEQGGRVRMVDVSQHDTEALAPIIQDYVCPGTIIQTDMWTAYTDLNDVGYVHRQVDKSDPENVADAAAGAETQVTGPTRKPPKKWFKNQCVQNDRLADKICEYLWRRHCLQRNIDLFGNLLEAIKAEYKVL